MRRHHAATSGLPHADTSGQDVLALTSPPPRADAARTRAHRWVAIKSTKPQGGWARLRGSFIGRWGWELALVNSPGNLHR
ncbi:hypothetical protein LIA77_10240 [Sarocladium implicatum]|nr:hypothetical protein LIA77_10240 [Sarocladium implicatum]